MATKKIDFPKVMDLYGLRPEKENGQLHILGSTSQASDLEASVSTRALRAMVGLQLCFD